MGVLQEDVLRMLRQAGEPLSGEKMSRELGVSRAAVWKAVSALRESGYRVEAHSAKGYRLLESPDLLSPGELEDAARTVGRQVLCLSSVDSTNNVCRHKAVEGAPDGLAVLAGEQTSGRGRRGRSFQSLPGKGLYLSVLLRPKAELAQVSQLTAWTAVALCAALKRTAGVEGEIKWPNDVLLEGKKLCGILTELGLEAETGALEYVVVGIGVNVGQDEADFGPELAGIATSLRLHGIQLRRADLAQAVLEELDRMYADFPQERAAYLEEYRRRCVTVGRQVRILRGEEETPAEAIGVEEDFSLLVRLPDGRRERVTSGEVSVRGLLGYQ